MMRVPWEPRQESKAGRPCQKLEGVALPLPMEPIATRPVASHEFSPSPSSMELATPPAAVTEMPPSQPEQQEQSNPINTNLSQSKPSSPSAALDPNVMNDTHLKSTRLVDDSVDATTQIRAKRARMAGLTIEQSSTRPWTKSCRLSFKTHCSKLSITTSRSSCETSAGGRRLLVSGSSMHLSCQSLGIRWSLGNRGVSRRSFLPGVPMNTVHRRRRWPRRG